MKNRLLRKWICVAICIAMVFGPVCPPVAVHAGTTITEVSVTGITEPYIGETPDYTANVPADADYYIGTDITGMSHDVNGIVWVDGDLKQVPSGSAFVGDKTYDVRMELYAKSGASFAEKNAITVTVNGQKGRVISRTSDTKIYIGFNFGTPKPEKTLVTSVELYHEDDITAKNYVRNLKVSKINGEPFSGDAYAGFQWYRDWNNFNNINDATAWDGLQFEGGYAYGVRINTLPEIDGYEYNTKSLAITIKTPSQGYTNAGDLSQGICFFWDKLAYKPDLESVDITMDGYCVGENITQLTFTSQQPIKTDGSYGLNGRYTIKQYNQSTGDFDVLSNTTFVPNKKYYLFYYLESDLDLKGLTSGYVRVNGKAAQASGKENGKTYYRFSLDELTEDDIPKTSVTSIVVSLPKAQPAAGDELYTPTVVSVNGDTNLASVVEKVEAEWYQNDFHVPNQGDYGPADSKFAQGKSYCLWMNLFLDKGYELADNYTVTMQTPSGNLKGMLDSKGSSYVTYEYYFNLGAPTELPMLSSCDVRLSGYQAGKKIEETTLEMTENGLSIPKEMLSYGMLYAIADQNQQPIETGTFAYDTQYYLGAIVAAYNCKLDGLTEAQIKSMTTLNGIHPETAIPMKMGEQLLVWQIYFKLPVLKQDGSGGLQHQCTFETVKEAAAMDQDGKVYEICKSCGTVKNETIIPAITSVKLSKEVFVYDGKTKKPSVVVKDRTGKTLVEDKDYTVIYPTASKKTGLYVIDVVMEGNYEGLESLNYQIIPAVGSCKLSVSSAVYNGKVKSPTVTVKDTAGNKLVKNTDYTVSVPKGRKAIGTYTYTIRFKGKYAGVTSKKLKLTIKPVKPTMQTPKAATKAVTVKWKKTPKAQTTGYQVMVATDKNFKKNVKKTYVKGYSKTSYKMTKLKAKTKYYVRVRTYKTVKGVKIYSDWSKPKSVKTK